MKSFIKIIFPLVVFATVVSSCDPAKEFETELKTIDSCVAVLDEIDTLLKGIKFDSLGLMVSHVNTNEEYMRQYYRADTIDMLLGDYMNNCKGVRKSLKNLAQTQKDFTEEIAALHLQFNNLKTDILNGVFDKEQIAGFLAAEKDALNNLNLKFTEFNRMQKEQSGVYYLCVPYVDDYVKKLTIENEDSLQ